MLDKIQSVFSDRHRVAYAGLVSLVVRQTQRQRLDCLGAGAPSSGAGLNGTAAQYLRDAHRTYTDGLLRTLFAMLDISEDEQTMLKTLTSDDADLMPSDMAHSLMTSATLDDSNGIAQDDSLRPKTSPENEQRTAHSVVAHLFVLSVSSGSFYDARARAILVHVASCLNVSLARVSAIEREMVAAIGYVNSVNNTALSPTSSCASGVSSAVEKRNKADNARRIAFVTLATIAGGVLIGATAGLAGPAVMGATTAAHMAHCGGTVAMGLGSSGVALFATGGAVTAGGMSSYKLMKKTRGISEFSFIAFHAGAQPANEATFNAISLDEKKEAPPPAQAKTPSALRIRQPSINSLSSPSSFRSMQFPASPYPTDSKTTPASTPEQKPITVTIAIPGWLGSTNPADTDSHAPFIRLSPETHGDLFSLLTDPSTMQEMGASITLLNYCTQSISKAGSIPAGPQWTHRLNYLLDTPWTAALEKAKQAGYLLADALESRVQGARPVTLVGFSLGARTIFQCCLELAKRPGCQALVESIVLCGMPLDVTESEWDAVGAVVTGKVVNAFHEGDTLLQLLFRKNTGGISRVAGLAAVSLPSLTKSRKKKEWVTNVDLADVIGDHIDYFNKCTAVLEACGLDVERDCEAEAVAAKVQYEADLEDARMFRFNEQWNRDVELFGKQQDFESAQTNGFGENAGSAGNAAGGGIMGWLRGSGSGRNSATAKSSKMTGFGSSNFVKLDD
ncbi:hypothetical protein CcCBS67573_g07485 [Chytriomyces confervae]|uniref:DUF726-domain-containing protein n=1 Tax=Chytriomyces confervae TaxID=246404 RepID=A0A507ETP5_9FUNG|nr:hypothetical protein HDU80_007356 [Chytriomyces hyalinus]TPX67463.1 hypothetical protein CcCBS67573_g07485 [Chytriomyces confervae]